MSRCPAVVTTGGNDEKIVDCLRGGGPADRTGLRDRHARDRSAQGGAGRHGHRCELAWRVAPPPLWLASPPLRLASWPSLRMVRTSALAPSLRVPPLLRGLRPLVTRGRHASIVPISASPRSALALRPEGARG